MSGPKYEYTVQWRWQDEDTWNTLGRLHQGIETAKREAEYIRRKYSKAESRVVRRQIVDWEVIPDV